MCMYGGYGDRASASVNSNFTPCTKKSMVLQRYSPFLFCVLITVVASMYINVPCVTRSGASQIACNPTETMVSCGFSQDGAQGTWIDDNNVCTAYPTGKTAMARCCTFPSDAITDASTVASPSDSLVDVTCPSGAVLTGCDPRHVSGTTRMFKGSWSGPLSSPPQSASWIPTENQCHAESWSVATLKAGARCLSFDPHYILECKTKAILTDFSNFGACEAGYSMMACNAWTDKEENANNLDMYYVDENDKCKVRQDAFTPLQVNAICCQLINTTTTTSSPTSKPTANPSTSPTDNPSRYPSLTPTDNPSRYPSTSPTDHPSGYPSIRPTANPSAQPSVDPTDNPSAGPTNRPSASSSAGPTAHPSGNPSVGPTNQPSGSVSAGPTAHPSASPSSSADPFAGPTAHPSGDPSVGPTNQPSADPSAHPSVDPTHRPSSDPTFRPSNHPSRQSTYDQETSSSGLVISVPATSADAFTAGTSDDAMFDLLKVIVIVVSVVMVFVIVITVIVCKARQWKTNMMQQMNEHAQAAADQVIAMQKQMATQRNTTHGDTTGTEAVQKSTVGAMTKELEMCVIPGKEHNDGEAEGTGEGMQVMQHTVEGMSGEQETVGATNHSGTTAGVGRSDANICVDCGEIKYGKIYDGDGQFYCNECWMHNNVALKRQETAGAEKDIKRFSLSETDHNNDGLWDDYGAGTPIGAMPQGAGTLGRTATAGIGLIEANESHESGQCTDCGEIHPGKIYDGDGQFYCNKCWMDYAPENMDIDHFIQ
eukprot:181256_1